jgi:hypothetical protein
MTQDHISEDLNVQLQNTSAYVSDSHAAFTLKSVKLTLCTQEVLIHIGDNIPENGNIK